MRTLALTMLVALTAIATAAAQVPKLSTGVVIVEPGGISVPVFRNETNKPMSVALTIEPTGSTTCNVRANDDETPLSVIAGSEGSALATVPPGNTVTIQAVGLNGSCKWRITSAVASEAP